MRPLKKSDPAAAGPYRLLAELGRGGMGRVLLGAARDGRLVAVKQVHARLADDDGFRVRFRREVAASRKVSGAFTAAVLDADADADSPWLASVFVTGPSLGAAVERAGALPEETVRRLAAGLAAALVEIHRAGLVHRDLKPDNVLLARDGVRVIDFGIARVARPGEVTELTQAGTVIGSPAFMSPEQAEGGELTPASDVFSLGSVLVLAATGRSPFVAATVALTLYNVVHAEPDLLGLPQGLRALVTRCLAKDPAARPSPAEILGLTGAADGTLWPPAVERMAAAQQEEIEALLRDPDGAARAPGGPDVDPDAPTATAPQAVGPARSGAPRGRRLRPRFLLPAAGVLVAACAGVAYGVRGEEPPTAPADRYLSVPLCAEAAGELPLPQQEMRQVGDHESPVRSSVTCHWVAAFDVVAGEDEPKPHASVSWSLERSGRLAGSGTSRTRLNLGSGRPETGVGAGDGAYWSTPGTAETCALGVSDGNLLVRVALGGPQHPAETCETEAKEVARAALAAVPR
ncbi:serine/threonine-protein kinase [Streptomyces sp. NBC_01294]|uniref:serine/threonine-protein kinase n=1 Tax=Streptomyces sp. NBC_01294 TaxID=2903815 RepID=UPI002DD7FC8F|nr:serine/threonine-protein kinase [Streptomyces sp. NBC_01294]WRZ59614.1 serine/threonine protein kinase [Streptomyces sp. NBC_01294]